MAEAVLAEETTAGQAMSQPSSPAKAVAGEAEWRSARPTLPLVGPFLGRDRSDRGARKEGGRQRTAGSQEALGTGGPPSNLGALPDVRTPQGQVLRTNVPGLCRQPMPLSVIFLFP